MLAERSSSSSVFWSSLIRYERYSDKGKGELQLQLLLSTQMGCQMKMGVNCGREGKRFRISSLVIDVACHR